MRLPWLHRGHPQVLCALLVALEVITRAGAAEIATITSPATNSVLEAGSAFEIAWNNAAATQATSVELDLYRSSVSGSEKVIEITTTNITSGSYLWDIPSNLGADAVYQIKLYDTKSPATFVFSSNFQIVAGSGNSGGTKTLPQSTRSATTQGLSTSTSATASATTSASPQQASSGLSSQTPIIVACSIVGGLVLIGFLALLASYWYRKSSMKKVSRSRASSTHQLKDNDMYRTATMSSAVELPVEDKIYEMDSVIPIQELEGSPVPPWPRTPSPTARIGDEKRAWKT